jgi:hypothetical protein
MRFFQTPQMKRKQTAQPNKPSKKIIPTRNTFDFTDRKGNQDDCTCLESTLNKYRDYRENFGTQRDSDFPESVVFDEETLQQFDFDGLSFCEDNCWFQIFRNRVEKMQYFCCRCSIQGSMRKNDSRSFVSKWVPSKGTISSHLFNLLLGKRSKDGRKSPSEILSTRSKNISVST